MVLTASAMLPLGTKAPAFELPDTVTGQPVSLEKIDPGKATVVMFICNHCPYVLHILDKLVTVAAQYKTKGINFVAISSNDIETYPEDHPEKMKALALQKQFSFPYLYDETQTIAKKYQAECTPDFYLFDNTLACQYRGRFDASSPGKETPVTGSDLVQALENLLTGKPIDSDQKPSLGCNIKWKD